MYPMHGYATHDGEHVLFVDMHSCARKLKLSSKLVTTVIGKFHNNYDLLCFHNLRALNEPGNVDLQTLNDEVVGFSTSDNSGGK